MARKKKRGEKLSLHLLTADDTPIRHCLRVEKLFQQRELNPASLPRVSKRECPRESGLGGSSNFLIGALPPSPRTLPSQRYVSQRPHIQPISPTGFPPRPALKTIQVPGQEVVEDVCTPIEKPPGLQNSRPTEFLGLLR